MIALAAAALVAGLLVLASPAKALPPGATVLVDRPSGFGALPFDGVGESEVGANALSSDGCFVVFSSHSDVLSATDDNAAENVFRLDLCTAGSPLTQVNTSSDGTPAEPLSDNEGATISADGRYVAFSSDAANLVPGVTARADEIFVKDLATGTLELASRGDGPNGRPAERAEVGVISGHGRSVAFVASGVLDTDNVNGAAGARDAYVRSLDDDTTHMVSVTTDDTRGGGVDSGTPPAIDHTGARVAFVTQNRLVTGDTDGSFDAYVRNQLGGAGENTQLVSVGAFGAANADAVALSGSSTRLAYTNGRVYVTTCALTCGSPSNVDGRAPNGTGAEGPFFPRPVENGVPQTPTELYWRTPTVLDPADTDGAVDLYGTSLTAPPATEIFMVLHRGRRRRRRRRGRASSSSSTCSGRPACRDRTAPRGRSGSRRSAESQTSRSRWARRRGSTAPAAPASDAGTSPATTGGSSPSRPRRRRWGARWASSDTWTRCSCVTSYPATTRS